MGPGDDGLAADNIPDMCESLFHDPPVVPFVECRYKVKLQMGFHCRTQPLLSDSAGPRWLSWLVLKVGPRGRARSGRRGCAV